MANLFELPRYIAVEGPIRVGKSTLAGILAERLNAQRVMEPDENPFLRSEEHTSELQSQSNIVCRLLLEKKKSGSFRCTGCASYCPTSPIYTFHTWPRG